MSVGNKKSRGNKAKRTWNRSIAADSARFDVHNSTSNEVLDTAIYWPCAEVDETIQDHIIPRRAITSKQNLSRNVYPTDGIVLHGKLPEKVNGEFTGRMIESSDCDRILYTEYSPKTLLNQGIPAPCKQPLVDRESSLVSGLDRRKMKQFNIDKQLDKPASWIGSNNPYCDHERMQFNVCLDCNGTQTTKDPKDSSILAPKLVKHLEK